MRSCFSSAFLLTLVALLSTAGYAQDGYGTSSPVTPPGPPQPANQAIDNPQNPQGEQLPAPTPLAVYVNSQPLSGMRTDVVPGIAYVPAEAFATAVGAEYSHSEAKDSLNLRYASLLLTLAVVTDPTVAAMRDDTMRLQGSSLSSPTYSPAAFLDSDGTILLPAQTVSAALGAEVSVSDVEGVPSLILLYPRATLLSLRYLPAGRSGSSHGTESIELSFSGLVPVQENVNSVLGVVTYRFLRADAERAQADLQGEQLRRARISSEQGWLELRLELTRGAESRLLSEEREGRYWVTIDIAAAGSFQTSRSPSPVPRAASVSSASVAAPNGTATNSSPTSSRPTASGLVLPTQEAGALPNRPHILLDPAHGGLDAGMDLGGVSEAAQVFALASRVQGELQQQGLEIELTRTIEQQTPLEQRSRLGVGVPLFLSLHAAAVPQKSYNVYYLGEASRSPSLELALQQNAERALATSGNETTDAVRRQVLLNLVPELSLGERYARQLTQEMASHGWRFERVDAAPIYVLAGAGGRGLLLEFSDQDLRDDASLERLAQALSQAVLGLYQYSLAGRN